MQDGQLEKVGCAVQSGAFDGDDQIIIGGQKRIIAARLADAAGNYAELESRRGQTGFQPAPIANLMRGPQQAERIDRQPIGDLGPLVRRSQHHHSPQAWVGDATVQASRTIGQIMAHHQVAEAMTDEMNRVDPLEPTQNLGQPCGMSCDRFARAGVVDVEGGVTPFHGEIFSQPAHAAS
jgi:hypothetical protein